VTILVESDQKDVADLEKYQLPPLRYFKNLVSLALSFPHDVPRAYCDLEIAPAIAASPELTGFGLNNFCYAMDGHETETCASLPSLLGTSRPELVQLKLERVPLPIAGLKQVISPKLQKLSVANLPSSRGLDFSWAKLWSILKEAGVELSTLSVGSGKAMDGMLAYLVSYTGLRKLEIREIQMDRQDLEDSAGHRFWHEIVPHHKDTLTELAVVPCFEGLWCYGPAAADAIVQCVSVHRLTLSACSVDPSWAEAKLSQAQENDKVDFHHLDEPYGAPENCGVCIIYSCSSRRRPLSFPYVYTAWA
jgi:hypothetical protein